MCSRKPHVKLPITLWVINMAMSIYHKDPPADTERRKPMGWKLEEKESALKQERRNEPSELSEEPSPLRMIQDRVYNRR